MADALPLSLFDYDLPPELIAQEPARPRDASRLLRLSRSSGAVSHHVFGELPTLLRAGDLLVVNRTKVIPARLQAQRPTGGRVEVLFLSPQGALETATRWEVMGRPGDAFKVGKTVITGGVSLRVVAREGANAMLEGDGPLWPLLEQRGEVPLPPYIKREAPVASDTADYQTVFAREPGAVAAPTASLHFTDAVLERLTAAGVERAEVVLHVGAGTFLPVREEHAGDVRAHAMHAEHYAIPEATVRAIEAARKRGGRVVPVGTTSLRALETWAATGEPSGSSRLFIYPGYEFRVTDALVTNFHVPRSTLLMLVSALAGRERVLAAYAEAVRARYRFFSYGDAMLIDT
ncbi:MAG: tRNA preQ1(34) S-adenosylmethionine ribosyltransferase-isomerase QueA [Myxococcota bacterium]|nr:tRNA preQ1(34) S-adenosylmethionine ribosyltransferase-isomerase QueA [Myxococcota bacterium]